MKFQREITLKDGRKCLLRSADGNDAEALLDIFIRSHGETDYLLSYPDETAFTVDDERNYLKAKYESPDEIEIMAFVDGMAVGSAGIGHVGVKEKVRHRAEFGISVLKDYWGLGIGKAMTKACIQCAKDAGYLQVELEAVADNGHALNLYESLGFEEFGRNPKGFRSRISGWQAVVLMRLELGQ